MSAEISKYNRRNEVIGMVKHMSGTSRWSLTLFRSGGYTKEDELKDALFSFGRTNSEVIDSSCKLRIPYGITHLLKRFQVSDDALEAGFIIDFSTKKMNDTQNERWVVFEMILSSSEKHPNCRPRDSCVYSIGYGHECFEMIEVSPLADKLPDKIWVQVRPLDDKTLAWVISQDNILLSDDKEQKTLHDFYDINVTLMNKEYIRLPGPPDSNYNFFNV